MSLKNGIFWLGITSNKGEYSGGWTYNTYSDSLMIYDNGTALSSDVFYTFSSLPTYTPYITVIDDGGYYTISNAENTRSIKRYNFYDNGTYNGLNTNLYSWTSGDLYGLNGYDLNNWLSETDEIGNHELFINSSTRLTETASDETLKDFENNIVIYEVDGVNHITYLCDSNILSDTCTGEAEYGEAKSKLKLGVIDDARCPYGAPDCSSFALFNEDWIVAYYTINDKIALPSLFTEYSESYPSTSYILANASCSFEAQPMTWANSTSNYVNVAGFSEKSTFVSTNDASAYANTIITVTCTSDLSDSTIWAYFYVQNTDPTSSNFRVETGNQNGYGQPHKLDDYETHIKAQWEVDTAYGTYYSCAYDWETPFGWLNSEGMAGGIETFHNLIEDTPQNIGLNDEYNYLSVLCRAQDLSSPLRATSWASREDILFTSNECADGYYDTSLTENGFYDAEYGDYLSYEFEKSRAYDLSLDLFTGGYDFGHYTNPITTYCTTEIYNSTGDLHPNANIYSYFWEHRWYIDALSVGNYSAEIRCFEEDVTADSCAGTYNNCGYGGSCVSCGMLNVDCEDGNYNIQQQCIASKCSNSTTKYDFCYNHQLYDIQVQAIDEISCTDREDIVVNARLLRNQQLTSWAILDSSSCRFGVYEYVTPNPVYAYAGTYEASTDSFRFTPPDLLTTPCDTQLYIYAQCTDANFSTPKTSMALVQILTSDYCVLDNKIVVPSGTCAHDITNEDSDKGSYCNSEAVLINRGDLCGCPRGTSYNSTSLQCDGTAIPGVFNWFLDWKFLSLTGILLILLFAPLLLKLLDISTRR